MDNFAVLALNYIQIMGWCVLVTEITLPVLQGRRKRLTGWGVLYMAALAAGSLLEAVMKAVAAWAGTVGAVGGSTLILYAAGFNLLNLMEILTPLLAAGAGFLFLYGKRTVIQQFMAVFTSVWVMIVNEFLAQTALIPFLGADNGFGDRTMPVFWVAEGLRFIVFILSFLCYRRFFCKSLKQLLAEGGECLTRFVKVMAAAFALFILLTAMLPTYSISFQSVKMQNCLLWIGAMALMMGINIILYWSFFTAIQVSAREMKIKADLEVASRIQCSVFPEDAVKLGEGKGFSVCGDMVPAREVGGDFYDYFLREDGRLVFVIGDVAGKGVPAALFMMSARILIRVWAKQLSEPGKILEAVNRELTENNKEDMFVTVFLCMYDWKNGTLSYSNAGHNPPYLCSRNGEAVSLPVRPGLVLGYMDGICYETRQRVLEPGEKLLLYTDGVTEAMNTENELFGKERLERLIRSWGTKNITECLQSVKEAVYDFAGEADQSDDITAALLERTGTGQEKG